MGHCCYGYLGRGVNSRLGVGAGANELGLLDRSVRYSSIARPGRNERQVEDRKCGCVLSSFCFTEETQRIQLIDSCSTRNNTWYSYVRFTSRLHPSKNASTSGAGASYCSCVR
ncbi:unnamed protein product [Ectocarpus sp. 13 AM-2016]